MLFEELTRVLVCSSPSTRTTRKRIFDIGARNVRYSHPNLELNDYDYYFDTPSSKRQDPDSVIMFPGVPVPRNNCSITNDCPPRAEKLNSWNYNQKLGKRFLNALDYLPPAEYIQEMEPSMYLYKYRLRQLLQGQRQATNE